MPKFSIIIPVYNVAPYLRECLDSVLAQSFVNWECIAVDDESTDSSPRILDEYAERDSRIKVIHQKNKGEGGARNAGIAAAQGEWVFFLDGDDVMASDALMHLSRVIEDYPGEKLIRFGYEQFHDGASWRPACLNANVKRKDISAQVLMSDFFTYVWQHLYRLDIIRNIQFMAYKRGCDRVFISDVMLNKIQSFVETPESFYGYRLRAGSAMNSVPSFQVLLDEMDHRLDIMEMIDASRKRVDYAGNWWLEGYFVNKMVGIIKRRENDAGKVKREWHRRMKRLLLVKGLSPQGKLFVRQCVCWRTWPQVNYRLFLHDQWRESPWLKPLTTVYRYLLGHGEFSRK